MRRSWGLAVGLALLTVSTVAAQERLRAVLPNDEDLQRYGLVRRWYGFAPVDGLRETIENATVVGDQIHLQTNQSRIHVMDAESGRFLWSAQLGRATRGQVGSAVNSNSVFVINGTSLYRLNRENGSQSWSLSLPEVPSAAPAADEQRVVVSTVDGRIYVYNVETHAVIWYYQTNAQLSLPAVLHDDKIACASQDGLLYVFGPAARNPLHRYQTGARITAPIATWGRLVILASEDYNVYAVNIRSGDTQWRTTLGSEILRPISVIEDQVFVSPSDDQLYVLNAEDGAVLWRYPRAQQFVAASAKRVYAADKYGRLVTLDRSTGRALGLWDTHRFDFRVLNESNDRLYLATRNGLVICCHEKENNKPVVHPKVLPPPPSGPTPRKPGAPAAEPAQPATKSAES